MMQRIAGVSPKRLARITGLLYLLVLVGGIIAQGFISDRLVRFNDAAATANNILAHKTMFQLGFTVYLIEMACQIAVTALFYVLLKPVNRSVALVSAFISLAGCIIKTASRLFYLAPVFILDGRGLSALNAEQLQAVALLFLKVNDHGAALALGLFGFSTFLEGYLIFKSTFLPRFLGVWSMLAGLGWLTYLYPPLGYRLFLYLALVGLLGAIVQIGWFLIVGVNEERWREQAAPV